MPQDRQRLIRLQTEYKKKFGKQWQPTIGVVIDDEYLDKLEDAIKRGDDETEFDHIPKGAVR